MANNWKDVVGAVAPTIATILGGPLAGMAVKAVSTAVLGRDDGTEEDIASAMASADPQVLARIKEADAQLKRDLAAANVKLEEIAGADRASARDREVKLQDPTTRILAYIALAGFFGVLGGQFYIALNGIAINTEVQRTLDITLGVLFAWVLAVKDYYFGSSAGSAQKNELLGRERSGR